MVSGAGRSPTRRCLRSVRPRSTIPVRIRLVGGRGHRPPPAAAPSRPPRRRQPSGRLADGRCGKMPGFGHHQGGDILADPPAVSSRKVSGRSNHNARAIPSRRDPSVGETWQASAI